MKLSAKQQELLDAMKRGVKVHRYYGRHSTYFRREDTNSKCTATINALETKGVIKIQPAILGQHRSRVTIKEDE